MFFGFIPRTFAATVTSGDLYVDTDVGNDANACTSAGAGNACATLSGAVGKVGTLTGNLVIHCKGTAADTTAVSISGKGTAVGGPTLTIQVDTTDRHSGVYTTSKYHLAASVGTDGVLDINEKSVIIDGLQVYNTNSGTGNCSAIFYTTATQVSHVLKNSILVGGRYTLRFTTTGTIYVLNSLVYGGNTGGVVIVSASPNVYLMNSVLQGPTYGVNRTSGNIFGYNSYAAGTTGWTIAAGSTLTNCFSNDGSASTGIAAYSISTFTNVTATTEDYRLVAGSALIGAGIDTHFLFSSPANVSTDIIGAQRTTDNHAWDVGAFKYGLATNTSVSGADFTFVIFGDPQYLIADYPHTLWDGQCQWVATNKSSLNIKAVLITGDFSNTTLATDFTNAIGDATHGLGIITGSGIPVVYASGNHDWLPTGETDLSARNLATFGTYLGSAALSGFSWFGAARETTNSSFYIKFTANGDKILIIALEIFPRAAAVTWAQSIITANPTYKVIILTHGYLQETGVRLLDATVYGPDTYNLLHGTPGPDNYSGQDLWDGLIKLNDSIRIVLSGHTYGTPYVSRAIPPLKNTSGHYVLEERVDYQAFNSGNNGVVELMTFHPSNSTVTITQWDTVGDVQDTTYATYDFPWSFDNPNSAPSLSYGSISAWNKGNMTIPYTLTDADSDTISLTVQYSTDNSNWSTATKGTGGDNITGLTSSPTGTSHTFVWATGTDLPTTEDSTVYFRITPSDGGGGLTAYTSSSFGVDNVAPTVSAFTLPATASSLTVSISSFVASDTGGVTGYKLTETNIAPAFDASGWTALAPTTYTFASEGSKTLYAWAKDAAGNVSTSLNAPITINTDNTPPLRSLGAPSSQLPFNTTSTTLSLTTDETATCKYSATPNTAYNSMTSFSSTNSTTHQTTIAGLSNGGGYLYYVKCADAVLNTNPDDYVISFSVSLSAPGSGGLITNYVFPAWVIAPTLTTIPPFTTPTIIPGCNNGTNGFSITTGQTCAGNTGTVITPPPVTTLPSTSSGPSAYNFGSVTLKLWSQGNAVKELQRFLNQNLNLNLAIDGILGPKTILAIKQYQRMNGLVADGMVGTKTKGKMISPSP